MSNARKEAINALLKIKTDNAYSNIVVDKTLEKSQLSLTDKAFATSLIYGVIEKNKTLDYIISKYSKMPLNKIRPFVLITLETAVYQMVFMEKIPDSAAVNESVNIIKKSKYKNLSGFANAVLRSFLRDEKKISYPSDKIGCLTVKYNVSEDLARLLFEQYSDETENILKGFDELDKGVTLKVNTVKIPVEELAEKLSKDFEVKQHSLCKDVLILKGQGSVRSLYGYKEGYFHIQDTASAICAKIVNAKENDRVLDVCAAPGGKSFSIAEGMKDKGEVLALDLYEHKVNLILKGAKRLGLNSIKSFVNDANVYNSDLCKFNKVLCDLPCSGLGILGKKPEIRYKNVAFIDNLPLLQYHLLETSMLYVEIGGLLFYSTCTINKKENQEVVKKFLENNKNFEPYEIGSDIPKCDFDESNTLTLFPHIHNTDGFFISAFKRMR